MPPAWKSTPAFRLLAVRILTFAIVCLGLSWAISTFERAVVSGDFWNVEARLLQFEIFSPATATRTLDSAVAQDLSPCDSHSQRALLLLEMPLADAALRSGATRVFDQRIRSLEARTRRVLSCTPRDSFVWLVAFGLENLHGQLDDHSFDLLAMSFETSPNEAWVAVRRTIVAIPVVHAAPEAVRQKILDEFQNLVRHKFVDIPARSYLKASDQTRALLRSRIEQLDLPSQKAFSDQLQKLRS